MTGRIYFIRRPTTGLIKIGYSKDPKRRLGDLERGGGEALELLGHMPGSQDDERLLHRKLASWRRMGEWFEDCLEVRAALHEALEHNQALPKPTEPPINMTRREDSEAVIKQTFYDCLDLAYGHLPNPAKAAARDAGVVQRAASGWFKRQNFPNLPASVNLGRNNPVMKQWWLTMFRILDTAEELDLLPSEALSTVLKEMQFEAEFFPKVM